MLFRIFFLALITNSFASQSKKDVCTILSICDYISAIRSEVAAVREEQQRQANILEGSSSAKTRTVSLSDINALAGRNNSELCTILSICNNLAELSAELAAVSAEQERQANLLEESCQTDKDPYPANCYEALKESQESGVTEIRVPEYSENPFKVACDQESRGGGWTIILRRTDGSEDFYREWTDFQRGFGQVNGEYFVGLDQLHALTSSERQELLVIVEDDAGERYEMYDNFRVGPEANNYTLESIGSFSGTAGNGLAHHLGMQFSTKDRDNDVRSNMHCAVEFVGAWWHREMLKSNLAGAYGNTKYEKTLRWYYDYHLKTAIMMIRPKTTSQE